MITALDHLVIAVKNLEAASERYRRLGFQVVPGGKHPTGSYNALIGFQDGAYIELLSFYEDSPAHNWWNALHQRGGGLIDFCMQTDDIQADYASFRAQGVDMSDLQTLSRVRTDGYELSWTNNHIHGRDQGLIPFLIEDKTPRAERIPKETTHANGVTGVATLTLATDNLERAAGVMSRVLKQSGESLTDETLNAWGIRFQVGPHKLDYLTPVDASSPLHAHVTSSAPRPYALTLTTTGQPQSYDVTATEGVRLSLV